MQEIWELWVWSLGWEDPLEEEMATHPSILAWKIPWTVEPAGLQSVRSQRVGHDWSDLACMHAQIAKENSSIPLYVLCYTFVIHVDTPLSRRWNMTSHCISWDYTQWLPAEEYNMERRKESGETWWNTTSSRWAVSVGPSFPMTYLRHCTFVWALPHFLALQNSPGSSVYFLPQS